jgi:hypothetical protein
MLLLKQGLHVEDILPNHSRYDCSFPNRRTGAAKDTVGGTPTDAVGTTALPDKLVGFGRVGFPVAKTD